MPSQRDASWARRQANRGHHFRIETRGPTRSATPSSTSRLTDLEQLELERTEAFLKRTRDEIGNRTG